MKVTIKYRSDTLLPTEITDALEKGKERLLDLSREPDKSLILFDVMRKELLNWFSDNADIENEYHKKSGCETIGCSYWNGYFCCDSEPKYDGVCRFNDYYWKNQDN
jgi:hypothetical protein